MRKERTRSMFLCFLVMAALLLLPVSVSAASKPAVPAKAPITKISAASGKVSLTWKKAANATRYRIYYKPYGTKSWKSVGSTSKTSYTHKSSSKYPLKAGKKYTYVVRGYNASSKKLGPYDSKGRTVTLPKPSPVKVSSIKLNKPSLTMTKKGGTYQLSASVSPANAANKSLSFKSSNTKVASVSSSGKITALSNGSAIITVSAKDGSGKKATCKVTVRLSSNASKLAAQVVSLVNKERAKIGFPPLTSYAPAEKAAMIRAKECKTLFSHTRPNGQDSSSILDELHISTWVFAENLAQGASTPAAVIKMWMDSPMHRFNILNPLVTHIGVGYYKGSNGVPYWAQIFLTNPS